MAAGSILIVAGVVKAQSGQEPDGVEKAPLKLKLNALNRDQCLGSGLELELELRNDGVEEITIDKADLWASYSYGQISGNDEGVGRGGGEGSSCDHCRGNLLKLLPGMGYWDKHKFVLNDFFDKEGTYSISTALPYKTGDADRPLLRSNAVTFRLYPCGPSQK